MSARDRPAATGSMAGRPVLTEVQRRGSLSVPFHPFLLAVLTPISILAQNGLEMSPSDATRAVLLELTLAGLLWLGWRAWTREWVRSALMASAVVAFFHAYGRLYTGSGHAALGHLRVFDSLVGSHSRLLPITGATLVLTAYAIHRLRRYERGMTTLLNAIILSLCVVGLGTVGLTEWRLSRAPAAAAAPLVPRAGTVRADELPDIYYIVLDGYGRSDVLQELYDLNNQPFIEFLQDSGFLVVEQARSNYMQTGLSLASSMNLEYLQSLPDLDPESDGQSARLDVQRWLWHSRLVHELRELGYSIITIDSGYRPTAIPSDFRLSGSSQGTNLLERLLIENSGMTLLQSLDWMPSSIQYPGYDLHRTRVEFALQMLQSGLEQTDQPRFVFAHLLVPHPPYVFDATGQHIQPPYPYVLLDGSAYPGDMDTYRREYRAQLFYLNSRLEDVVPAILAASARPTLVILQGDHGPGSELDWESLDSTLARERFGVLMAIHAPQNHTRGSEEILSPVNLLRWTLSSIARIELPLLPDQSYFSTWDQPLSFEQVPDELLSPVRKSPEGGAH